MSPLIRTLSTFLPKQRVITDNLRRFAYGTDASLYRLVPEVVSGSKTSRRFNPCSRRQGNTSAR